MNKIVKFPEVYRELRKWNYKKHIYEPYKVPYFWRTVVISSELTDTINCAECGKQLTFGNSYTSMQIHNSIGLGFCVCEECYQKEGEERKKYKYEDV